MYFVALATDYDGTLAEDGKVSSSTISALERCAKSGRKLILVTGRELPDLRRVFPELGQFNLVVAENGALLYDPSTETETPLGSGATTRIPRMAKAPRCKPAIGGPQHRRDLGTE